MCNMYLIPSLLMQVDHSIVESFAQGGRSCITSRVYPTKAIHEDAQLFLFNNATDAKVKASLKVWQMSSADMEVSKSPRGAYNSYIVLIVCFLLYFKV